MILSPKQETVYGAIIAFQAERRFAPTPREIYDRTPYRPKELKGIIGRLIVKGFVARCKIGSLYANEPTHIRVVREVCAAAGISEVELFGRRKAEPLIRARRTITKILHREFDYLITDVARILNRDDSTLHDYLNREKAAMRSRSRSIRLYGERVSP